MVHLRFIGCAWEMSVEKQKRKIVCDRYKLGRGREGGEGKKLEFQDLDSFRGERVRPGKQWLTAKHKGS